jgi:hypothetical protein
MTLLQNQRKKNECRWNREAADKGMVAVEGRMVQEIWEEESRTKERGEEIDEQKKHRE